MVEWNSILQNNLSSAYLHTEREVCFICHTKKTNSPPSKIQKSAHKRYAVIQAIIA